MKAKNIMKTLFVTLLGLGLSSIVHAESSQVKFSGRILAESCTVVTADKTKTVVLGDHNKSALATVGSMTSKMRITKFILGTILVILLIMIIQ